MDNLNLFIPITKVDAAKRLVYGLATAEVEDRSGEICDYELTKPLYEKWSGDIHKSTDGKSLGNLRAMHGKVAAGKVTAINFNDDAKQIEVCAKVVDDAEWNKVEEGVYTGFSQGGAYVKRWKDTAGLQRYTAAPSEISLVDLPCLSTATFQMVKADGATEDRTFKSIATPVVLTNEQISAKATELAKVAGDETKWASFIEPARAELEKLAAEAVKADATKEIPAVAKALTPVDGEEWEQVWLCKRDGKTFKTKAELRTHITELDAAEAVAKTTAPALAAIEEISEKLGVEKRDFTQEERDAAAKTGAAMSDGSFPIKNGEDLKNAVKAYGRAKDKPAAKKHITKRAGELGLTADLPDDWKAAKILAPDLNKGLWTVAWLANTLDSLHSMLQSSEWEEMMERDTSSDVPTKLKNLLVTACDILRDMVVEETGELFEGSQDGALPDLIVIEAAAGKIKPGSLDALLKFMSDKPNLSTAAAALEKVGARNSKADKNKIQAMHDNAVDLGADCPADAGKAHGHGDLSKIEGEFAKMTAERDGLAKAINNKIMPLLGEISKRVKNIEEQPLPLPISRLVTKVDDNRGTSASPEAELQKMMSTPEGREAVSLLLIKSAQAQPQR